jgi:hypothetical protein
LLLLPAAVDNAAMPTEPSKTDPPKRKRRWFQFSLRTVLFAITIFSVQCGAWIPLLTESQAKRQRRESIQRRLEVYWNGQGFHGASVANACAWLADRFAKAHESPAQK